ncbi:Group 33 mite allergen-like protein (alpha tubulin) [Euroglyphus maynei]|uniref:Tubulin alpha chain n=1 Tax=Euroglyphus maynei TaxID=6958 RepID=A0A1Y3AQA7_EURMA|nr:Group 33 mite allergen-like protein (alpha tubulin) [Euroglyphus maynei]
MRECVTILIGQAGIQIGDTFWDVIRAEHGIETDGQIDNQRNRNENEILDTMFNEASRTGYYVPRTVMVDNDPSVIDQILSGPKGKNLFSSRMTVTGNEDAANNFSRGFYTLSSKILPPTIDVIRKSVELCDSFQGFLMFNSFGGGTGSGFSARLIDQLETMFNGDRIQRLEFNVFPSPRLSTAIVEPYNALFRAHHSLARSNCMFLFDNEACYEICRRQLDVERAHYSHINQLISLVASSVTASTRFSGPLNVDLAEFETNLVPYPRIHFPSASYAPISTPCCQSFNQSIKTLTQACFESRNRMIKFNSSSKIQYKQQRENGKYITSCLLYRGDCTPKEVNQAMVDLKQQEHFVHWSPAGMKCGIASEPPKMLEDIGQTNRAVCALSNHTGMVECWRLLCRKFDLMYNKRAFVHWYVSEGMEEMEFNEAREDLECLIDDYMEIEHSETASFDTMDNNMTMKNGEMNNHNNNDNDNDDEKSIYIQS